MFGFLKSKKQKLFDRYGEVIHGATLAGAAYGYLKRIDSGQALKSFFEIYEEYEAITVKLIDPNQQENAGMFMRELFNDASNDDGLVGEMNGGKVEGIERELIRNIDLAKQVLSKAK